MLWINFKQEIYAVSIVPYALHHSQLHTNEYPISYQVINRNDDSIAVRIYPNAITYPYSDTKVCDDYR